MGRQIGEFIEALQLLIELTTYLLTENCPFKRRKGLFRVGGGTERSLSLSTPARSAPPSSSSTSVTKLREKQLWPTEPLIKSTVCVYIELVQHSHVLMACGKDKSNYASVIELTYCLLSSDSKIGFWGL